MSGVKQVSARSVAGIRGANCDREEISFNGATQRQAFGLVKVSRVRRVSGTGQRSEGWKVLWMRHR